MHRRNSRLACMKAAGCCRCCCCPVSTAQIPKTSDSPVQPSRLVCMMHACNTQRHSTRDHQQASYACRKLPAFLQAPPLIRTATLHSSSMVQGIPASYAADTQQVSSSRHISGVRQLVVSQASLQALQVPLSLKCCHAIHAHSGNEP